MWLLFTGSLPWRGILKIYFISIDLNEAKKNTCDTDQGEGKVERAFSPYQCSVFVSNNDGMPDESCLQPFFVPLILYLKLRVLHIGIHFYSL